MKKVDLTADYRWTPVELETMLHCYYSPTSIPQTPASSDALAGLIRAGMVEELKDPKYPDGFRATDKGRLFVTALCSVPEPTMAWVIPAQEEVHT